jgi:hypothetical protein
LAPQLAKGLAQASPRERVAYCLAVDYSASERFITTGWVYIKKPHLYFKLVEWRTPIRVKSPAVPTSEACLVKPIPGVKTADRFFKMDYAPKDFIETFGPLGASIMNKRGEVVFKLAGLDLVKRLEAGSQSSGAVNSLNEPEATVNQPAASPAKTDDRLTPQQAAPIQQPQLSREVAPKPQSRTKPKPVSGAASVGQPTP